MQRVRSLYHISEGAPVFKAQNIVGRSAKLRLTATGLPRGSRVASHGVVGFEVILGAVS
jgi:hypothetical protein